MCTILGGIMEYVWIIPNFRKKMTLEIIKGPSENMVFILQNNKCMYTNSIFWNLSPFNLT